jgi:Tol biopolymer transport system component
VYSLCYAHSQIVDATTAKVVIDDGTATQPTMSTTGALAWVRDVSGINVLMVRMPDGRELQLTSLELGSVRTPAFSLDGERLAFGVSGPSAGLYTMKLSLPGAVNQLTDGKRDVGPTWTANGKIGFTRGDANANDQAYVASLDPTVPLQRLGPGTRTVYGSRGNELLIGDEESQAMYWIDVETGRTRTGPPRPRGYLTAAAVSPRGTWVVYQLGANGQDLWRVSTDAAGALEHVVSYGAAQTVSQPAITDDGHVLASPSRWLGDLVIVPARPGARF